MSHTAFLQHLRLISCLCLCSCNDLLVFGGSRPLPSSCSAPPPSCSREINQDNTAAECSSAVNLDLPLAALTGKCNAANAGVGVCLSCLQGHGRQPVWVLSELSPCERVFCRLFSVHWGLKTSENSYLALFLMVLSLSECTPVKLN